MTFTAGILIIGDEILSGRTLDTNTQTIAKALFEKGIDLYEVRTVRDDEEDIVEAVNALRSKYTYVFTTGGIGSTHDDITPQAMAKAFNKSLVQHPDILKSIYDHYKEFTNEYRIQMAMVPEGCHLILNSVSHVPSFYMENVFVMAGMPSVLKAMVEYVMTILKDGIPTEAVSITSEVLEGIMAGSLKDIQEQHLNVSIGSYPFYTPPLMGSTIVLKSRDRDALQKASHQVYDMLKAHGGNPEIKQGF